jgi:hypothetical protein
MQWLVGRERGALRSTCNPPHRRDLPRVAPSCGPRGWPAPHVALASRCLESREGMPPDGGAAAQPAAVDRAGRIGSASAVCRRRLSLPGSDFLMLHVLREVIGTARLTRRRRHAGPMLSS